MGLNPRGACVCIGVPEGQATLAGSREAPLALKELTLHELVTGQLCGDVI